jgi:hypothetical protein
MTTADNTVPTAEIIWTQDVPPDVKWLRRTNIRACRLRRTTKFLDGDKTRPLYAFLKARKGNLTDKYYGETAVFYRDTMLDPHYDNSPNTPSEAVPVSRLRELPVSKGGAK